MKILVVGGAGYIGSNAVKQLLDQNYEVVVADSLFTGHLAAVDKRAKFYQGNILDQKFLDKIFNEQDIKAVMHFAAYSLVGESVQKPLKYYQNNVSGMISLLKAMKNHNVKDIIFSSSAATYGVPKVSPISENTPLNPINPYGATKMMMERIMHDADIADGIKYVALRYFNVAGASLDGNIGEDHQPETHLIPNILKSVLNPDKIFTIFGDDYDTPDGTNVRDYVDVVDLIDAHILALQYLLKNQTSDVFNLGSAHGYSNLEILKSAMKVTGQNIPYVIGDRRPGDPDTLVANSTKARKVLNWQPQHENVDDIIQSAWKWHKNHPNGYEN